MTSPLPSAWMRVRNGSIAMAPSIAPVLSATDISGKGNRVSSTSRDRRPPARRKWSRPASAPEAREGTRVEPRYGASGLLRDGIATGARADVFASANLEHPRSLG